MKRIPDRCCDILKVQPIRRAIEEMNVACWVTGLRCTEGRTRTDFQEIEERDEGLIKLNPILIMARERSLAIPGPLSGAGESALRARDTVRWAARRALKSPTARTSAPAAGSARASAAASAASTRGRSRSPRPRRHKYQTGQVRRSHMSIAVRRCGRRAGISSDRSCRLHALHMRGAAKGAGR